MNLKMDWEVFALVIPIVISVSLLILYFALPVYHFGNLIDNAHRKLEELQQGTLKIQLRTEGPYAVIEIGNTGGMPQEVTKNFSQDSRPLQSGTGDGRGQGLSIVKLFTVMHNGIAELESPAGANWTTFRVKLPLQ